MYGGQWPNFSPPQFPALSSRGTLRRRGEPLSCAVFLHICFTFAPLLPTRPIKHKGIIRVQRPFLPGLTVPPSFLLRAQSSRFYLTLWDPDTSVKLEKSRVWSWDDIGGRGGGVGGTMKGRG